MADPIVANVVVSAPSQLFTMPREFKSVFNGMIYIGKIDTDPTIPANQIQVYLENEDGSLVPMPQPIRTNAGGYPVYNGKVSKFVTVEGHSMLIQDANGVQLFYFPNVLKYDPDQLRQELAGPNGYQLVPSVQIQQWKNEGDVRGWGDGEAGFIAAMEEKFLAGGGSLYVNKDIVFSSPVQHKAGVTVTWRADAIFPLGFTADYAYVLDGGYANPYDNSQHFTTIQKTRCIGLRARAENYVTGVQSKALLSTHGAGNLLENCVFIGFNLGGIVDELTYETTMTNISLVVSSSRSITSIGLNTKSTDGRFTNIAPTGYATGLVNEKGGNVFINIHPWGNTSSGAVGVMGKMHVGIENKQNGEQSSFYGCIPDYAVRKDVSLPPGRSNGGVAIISDAWRCNFDSCIALCGPAEEDGKTLPIISTAQLCNYIGFNVSNPAKATPQYISFESGSALQNKIYGGVLGEHFAKGGGFTTPISISPATGVTITSVTSKAGIDEGVFRCILNCTISQSGASGTVIELDVLPAFGVTSGIGDALGLIGVLQNTQANEGKVPFDFTPVVYAPNKIRILISFVDGTSTYAKFGDITSGAAKAVSFNLSIHNDRIV